VTEALTDRLRVAASAGYDEWRVQNPKDGAFCIAYSWPDTMSPEREARAWLADHKARFPDSPKAGYVVACVRVVPLKDRLLAEAADTIEQMRETMRQVVLALHEAGHAPKHEQHVADAVRAALAAPAVPPQKPLHIEALNDAWEDRDRDYVRCFHSFAAGVSVAERAHGILLAAAPTAELIPGTEEARHVIEHGHACIAPRRVESPQAGAVAAHQARAGCERDDRA